METRESVGGGMYLELVTNLSMINTKIIENFSYMKGGGAYLNKV